MSAAENTAFMAKAEVWQRGVDRADIDRLEQRFGRGTLAFLEAAVKDAILDKEIACRAWGDSIGFAYVDPHSVVVTREAVTSLPVEIARKGRAIGLYLIGDVLSVAMAEPDNLKLVRNLEHIVERRVSPVFALPCEVLDAIDIHYATKEDITDTITRFEQAQTVLKKSLDASDLEALSQSVSLIEVVNAILFYAMNERASDIHIEPQREDCRIRLRVDGRLANYFSMSSPVTQAVTARLKVVCKLDIAESRLPQDGRFSLPLGSGRADFRVSFMPAIHGNKVVIRILAGSGSKLMTLDEMQISRSVLQPMRKLIQSPNGIFFVTGPTGSGKTTTLYAALQELNVPEKNLSTVEDPVEIQLGGLNQVQVHPRIGLNFAAVLRSLLRQDPDIILVGEIRDKETASIAVEAALTGHLVLSTLHTNTAIQAITRLVEMGIEPYMVAPSILGVIGQRLAARICSGCKEAYRPSREILEELFVDLPESLDNVFFYHGTGCSGCKERGYKGRVAFHELVVVTEELRQMINRNAEVTEMRDAAYEVGYRPMRYDGFKKMLMGLTSLKEVESHSTTEWRIVEA